jgi:putative PIN family toxin of toxin-antitoxin system
MAGLLNLDGGAAKIIEHFRKGAFELIISREVFEEYLHVIHYFDNKIPYHRSEELLELIFERAVKVRPANAKGLCKDPDDEKFLDTAISGNAQYIVTKNKKDFPPNLATVKIVNVREFLKEIER